jgi:DNA-binding transcriptional ArsR family regulator
MIAETTRWVMALSHPDRRQILRIVNETDAIDVAALSRRLSMAQGRVSYHLAVLDELGWLRTALAASAPPRRDDSSRR